MTLRLLQAPAETPVSLAEAREHLRLPDTSQDATVSALIAAATGWLDGAEGVLGRALVTQTWEWRLDGCHVALANDRWAAPLPLAPAQSIQSVTYLDQAGTLQTLAEDQYVLDADLVAPKLRPAYQAVWPYVRPEPDAFRIAFVAGYGAASAVPAPLKQAILLLIGDMYANRGDGPADAGQIAPPAVLRLIGPYRREVC